MILPEERLVKVNGKEYVTVQDFAYATNKSPSAIYNLMKEGNYYRKLEHIKIGKTLFVAWEEMIDFPFTLQGSDGTIYHYDYDGKVVKDK
jgi:hypothetical protein